MSVARLDRAEAEICLLFVDKLTLAHHAEPQPVEIGRVRRPGQQVGYMRAHGRVFRAHRKFRSRSRDDVSLWINHLQNSVRTAAERALEA